MAWNWNANAPFIHLQSERATFDFSSFFLVYRETLQKEIPTTATTDSPHSGVCCLHGVASRHRILGDINSRTDLFSPRPWIRSNTVLFCNCILPIWPLGLTSELSTSIELSSCHNQNKARNQGSPSWDCTNSETGCESRLIEPYP